MFDLKALATLPLTDPLQLAQAPNHELELDLLRLCDCDLLDRLDLDPLLP